MAPSTTAARIGQCREHLFTTGCRGVALARFVSAGISRRAKRDRQFGLERRAIKSAKTIAVQLLVRVEHPKREYHTPGYRIEIVTDRPRRNVIVGTKHHPQTGARS